MVKKRYISAKGQEINFDLLTNSNQLMIAVGNANLNARGDVIGPGGKIIETAEEILMKATKAQAADPTTSYDQANPKAVKMVSIKDSVNMATAYNNAPVVIDEEQLKTPVEIVQEAEAKVNASKENDKKKESKRKIVDKED